MPIITRHSETPGVVPTTAQLELGELAINTADSKLFAENTSGQVIELSYRDARARSAITVTDSGGDGSLSYNSSTGVFTYTGPSSTEVRAHFSAGTGVTLTSGQIAIGQAVGTTDNVTFNNLTVNGNLTVSGTTTTVNTETINLADNIITLNSNATGSPTENAGIEVNRGSSSSVSLRWNETNDEWEYTKDGTNYSTLVGRTETQTLTNKTINLTSNTLLGTTAQFNTALSDGDFTTLAGTETLTNKSLSDNTTFFIDETDGTKKMQFQLSGITTATTRTLTVPNVNGTIITTGDTGTVTSTMIADSTIVNTDISASAAIAVSKLAASTISGITLGNNLATLTIGTGLSGTSYNGSTGVTIANTGVTSLTTSSGLSTNTSATGAVSITNTGVTSITAGSNITISGSTGAVTISSTASGGGGSSSSTNAYAMFLA